MHSQGFKNPSNQLIREDEAQQVRGHFGQGVGLLFHKMKHNAPVFHDGDIVFHA